MHFPEFRIIFQDVDGCLNPADGEDFGVTPEWEASASQIRMLHAIDKAVEESPIEHFVINTGRFWPILENIVKHFSSPKIRYFVMEHASALAVGDYLNDLAVFEAFPRVMCPKNAHSRIRELTAAKQGGGYISEHPYGKSLIDLLNHLTLGKSRKCDSS